jgi:tRNA(His) guanylyltransferase
MDALGDRMKGYESVPRARLVPKMPVLIRLDGKAFHTLTRGMEKPFDERFQRCMWETARALCAQIQGCQVAYVQSDEITLLLVDYQTIKTQGWFEYDLQKMVSISAAIASNAFNAELARAFPDKPPALFDSRAWNLPREEVTNCFIWRQQDATRNSILGLAQAHFSHREMHGKNTSVLQDMLHAKGINWNDCLTWQKRGICVVKETFEVEPPLGHGPPGHGEAHYEQKAQRTRWTVDENIPIFTQNRNYIDRFVYSTGADE